MMRLRIGSLMEPMSKQVQNLDPGKKLLDLSIFWDIFDRWLKNCILNYLKRCGACSFGRVLAVGSKCWVFFELYLPVTNWVILFESFHLPGPPGFSLLIFKALGPATVTLAGLDRDSFRRCWGAETDSHNISWVGALQSVWGPIVF